MEPTKMELCEAEENFQFARSYQLEALEKAIMQNTIVFLETGSGKTLIAIMLLRRYAHLLRRPSQTNIAVFLVPTVVLVTQQADYIKTHTDLKVGKYWGEMGVDFWDSATWKKEQENNEVLVMTPKILLDALSHTYIKLDMIKVLIFDECHNARGRHPYACIMKDFYHRQLHTGEVPRIFGMTASPVKSKAKGSDSQDYGKDIEDLENLMNSKVYTCVSEDVLAEFIPFPNAKIQFYNENIPSTLQKHLIGVVGMLGKKHMSALTKLDIEKSTEESISNKLKKLSSTYDYCLGELGFWPALKAAEILSSNDADVFSWGELDIHGLAIIRSFNSDVVKGLSGYIPSGFNWSLSDVKAYMDAGILTSKVLCLVESLLQYRTRNDLRCIIFVERVITAMVLEAIMDELLFTRTDWKTRYIAGNQSALQSQSRKEQNKIVEEFRAGKVQILVATSILEEGLDVQKCNLVVRFDPSANVCSFIQSRGRARMQNSDFLLMVKGGDASELSKLQNYLSSGDVMRRESLNHALLPCQPIKFDEFDDIIYRVPSTGAIVTLSSSISLIHFYCSRLPSDGYFKPSPRFTIDKALGTCTLQFPNSCPIQSVSVEGNVKILKRLACLEGVKKLHEARALTDSLVPDIVVEERIVQELEREPYNDDQTSYVPPELVSHSPSRPAVYHCYVMALKQNFSYDISTHDIVLVLKTQLDTDVGNMDFDMEVDHGKMSVNLKYFGTINLTVEQISLCRRFQVAVLRVLRDRDFKLVEALDALCKWEKNDNAHVSHYDYLLLPCLPNKSPVIDWHSICSSFTNFDSRKRLFQDDVYTKNGFVRCGVLRNCLVFTPHNGYIYCVSGFLPGMNGNSLLKMRDGKLVSYKNYYRTRHGINLCFENQTLLLGRQVFRPQNYLLKCRHRREKEPSDASVELPPELCVVIMSPISIATIYSFSFIPSIMHRVESLLLSANLRRIIMDHCMQNVNIPATKVLEALTTKQCQESFHLESLETLGDSFLKYAVGLRLFKTFNNNHEGLLSIKKERMTSNAALCKLGCQRKIPGFIRSDSCDPKKWIIPGDLPGSCILEEAFLSNTRNIYIRGIRKLKSKRVADVVEALIGAFLISGGEVAALLFMNWLGIEVEFSGITHQSLLTHPHMHVNIGQLESLLNYSFRDPSLLVEALTHGSYMLPEIPRCYQRLEFLGDAVLDHVITDHLYFKHPGMSPGLLTDLRSASVNNDCYALSAIRAGLNKHILHASPQLYRKIGDTVSYLEKNKIVLESTFGWELDTNFPKVLADVIESLAGAIFVDSGCNKEVVLKSMLPLLDPLVTPETLKLHPVRELHDLCQKSNYVMRKPVKTYKDGVPSITLEVEANGEIYSHTCTASDKDTATKVASKHILKSLKECKSKPRNV